MASNTKDEVHVDDMFIDDAAIDDFQGNAADRADMLRMGKSQELRRNFRFITIFGFSMILMQSWEVSSSLAVIGLLNGGTAGVIWMFPICWVGLFLTNTSMAEMGSMAPTVGGQYHWVSEFAPRKHQRFLSYLMGWLCVLGWQVSCASAAYTTATQLQGLIVLNCPETYTYEYWHGTLMTIAFAAFSVVFNTLFARKLPLLEGIVLVIHICAFVAFIITLWVLAPISDAKAVFTQFNDGGGWGNLGISTLVGITGSTLPLIGADAAVHMSEELKDASRTLPRTMIWSTALNGLMGWIMIITFCFTLGNLDEVLASQTGYPYIQVYYNATQSKGGATVMVIIIVFMSLLCNLTMVATASRQLFAFARDGGLPFRNWFQKIDPRWDVPLNAITTTFIVSAILSLIAIGSPVALNSIMSLATAGLLSSYICSISCLAWRRWTGNPLLPSKFSLGRWGLAINLSSLAFLLVVFVFSFFPTAPHPDAAGMNWTILIYGVVVVFCLGYYFVGKHEYAGPVEYVRKLE